MAIEDKYLVEKRNALNELRSSNMSLQELRFLSIYLAKINSRDINTRLVRFSLTDFQKIMGLGKLNFKQIGETTDDLLKKIIKIPKENGGFEKFQLFKKCTFDIDEDNERYIEIDAHDESLQLMFEFKDKYFSYRLWNALRLNSTNQLRMFELLKQYEKIGERIISVTELKELLGISKDDYTRWDSFKQDVLEVCKKALEEYTDIKFTYEPHGKKGRGGKILKLKFNIFKNENYNDPLSLDDFIKSQNDEITLLRGFADEYLEFLAGACNDEFNEKEMRILYDFVINIIPYKSGRDMRFDHYDYLKRKHNELDYQASRRSISNRFGYLRTMIKADFDDINNPST